MYINLWIWFATFIWIKQKMFSFYSKFWIRRLSLVMGMLLVVVMHQPHNFLEWDTYPWGYLHLRMWLRWLQILGLWDTSTHTLDHALDVVHGKSHKHDSTYCYHGETSVSNMRTISVTLLVEDNMVLLKTQQIPCIYEYIN